MEHIRECHGTVIDNYRPHESKSIVVIYIPWSNMVDNQKVRYTPLRNWNTEWIVTLLFED